MNDIYKDVDDDQRAGQKSEHNCFQLRDKQFPETGFPGIAFHIYSPPAVDCKCKWSESISWSTHTRTHTHINWSTNDDMLMETCKKYWTSAPPRIKVNSIITHAHPKMSLDIRKSIHSRSHIGLHAMKASRMVWGMIAVVSNGVGVNEVGFICAFFVAALVESVFKWVNNQRGGNAF